jgi:hypothetical protein
MALQSLLWVIIAHDSAYDGLRLARAFAEKPAHEPTSKKSNGGGERSESLISVDCM